MYIVALTTLKCSISGLDTKLSPAALCPMGSVESGAQQYQLPASASCATELTRQALHHKMSRYRPSSQKWQMLPWLFLTLAAVQKGSRGGLQHPEASGATLDK